VRSATPDARDKSAMESGSRAPAARHRRARCCRQAFDAARP